MEKIIKILIIVIIIADLTVTVATGRVNEEGAITALKSAGFTDIKTGGYGWFACGQKDFYQTKFTAINPVGKKSSGVVCSGLFFKNSTIRFD